MSETDPHGIDPHSPGAKLDSGKTRVALMLGGFPRALQAVAEVTTFGASKYTPNGWMHVLGGRDRYADARDRHRLLRDQGALVDPDSSLLHEAHEVWNALASFELHLREAENTEMLQTATWIVDPSGKTPPRQL